MLQRLFSSFVIFSKIVTRTPPVPSTLPLALSPKHENGKDAEAVSITAAECSLLIPAAAWLEVVQHHPGADQGVRGSPRLIPRPAFPCRFTLHANTRVLPSPRHADNGDTCATWCQATYYQALQDTSARCIRLADGNATLALPATFPYCSEIFSSP